MTGADGHLWWLPGAWRILRAIQETRPFLGESMSAAWLRTCALILLGVLSAVAQGKEKQPAAIVVGGGMAGLTAAYELQQQGWQVTLLEAKPSIGGRSGLASTEWIGSGKLQPTLHAYLKDFKLATVAAPDYVRTPAT